MKFVLKNRVKELRARLNLNQAEVAADAGVTRQTILAIEKGRLTPSIAVALKLARVLREPVDYVFYLDRVSDFDRVGVNEPVAAVASMSASVVPVVPPVVVMTTELAPDPLAEQSAADREVVGVEEAVLPVSEPVETPEETAQPVSDAAPTRPAQEEPGAIFDFV